MVILTWSVTFEITPNQQATLRCPETKLSDLVEVLRMSNAKNMELVREENPAEIRQQVVS